MLDSLKLIHREAGRSGADDGCKIVSAVEVWCYFTAQAFVASHTKRDQNPYLEIHSLEMLSGSFSDTPIAVFTCPGFGLGQFDVLDTEQGEGDYPTQSAGLFPP